MPTAWTGVSLPRQDAALNHPGRLAQCDASHAGTVFGHLECSGPKRSPDREPFRIFFIPPLLDDIGLSSALSQYVHGFAKRGGVFVDSDIPKDLGRVGKETEMTLFRVTQECLTNVHRHSQSSKTSVCIRRERGKIRMEVRDAGVDMALLKNGDIASVGIEILEIPERVRQLNGKMEIFSREGPGTSISMLIPEERSHRKQHP
jgi:signal transduction histidine kinase